MWFNDGELAKLQLDYKHSDKAIEELEMQVQAASRTPQEKAEFERTLADVPHSQTGVIGQSMEVIWAVECSI
jgi:16S rRNA C967 or C1407 C5-methylase (RsmB/RsmF family)